MVKNLPASAGDIRDVGSVPGLERPPGGGHDNPFQYSAARINSEIKRCLLFGRKVLTNLVY